MSKIVDLRHLRFLQGVREHCDVIKAMQEAGLTMDEANEYLEDVAAYIAVVECIREVNEEKILECHRQDVAQLEIIKNMRLDKLAEQSDKLVQEKKNASASA